MEPKDASAEIEVSPCSDTDSGIESRVATTDSGGEGSREAVTASTFAIPGFRDERDNQTVSALTLTTAVDETISKDARDAELGMDTTWEELRAALRTCCELGLIRLSLRADEMASASYQALVARGGKEITQHVQTAVQEEFEAIFGMGERAEVAHEAHSVSNLGKLHDLASLSSMTGCEFESDFDSKKSVIFAIFGELLKVASDGAAEANRVDKASLMLKKIAKSSVRLATSLRSVRQRRGGPYEPDPK